MPHEEEGAEEETQPQRIPNQMPDPVGEVVGAASQPDTRRRLIGTETTPFGILSPGLGPETLATRPQPALEEVLQVQTSPLPGSKMANQLPPHSETHMAGGDDEVHSFDIISVYNQILMRSGWEDEDGRVVQEEITPVASGTDTQTTILNSVPSGVQVDTPLIRLESSTPVANPTGRRVQADFSAQQGTPSDAVLRLTLIDSAGLTIRSLRIHSVLDGLTDVAQMKLRADAENNRFVEMVLTSDGNNSLQRVDFSGSDGDPRLTGVATPALGTDAANKDYVDFAVGAVSSAPFVTLGLSASLSAETSILEADESDLPDDDLHWKWDSASNRQMIIANIGAGTAALATDLINEVTGAAGVTIDSVLLKDGEVGPLADTKKIIFGTDSDASITFNDPDLAIDTGTKQFIVTSGTVTFGTALFRLTNPNARLDLAGASSHINFGGTPYILRSTSLIMAFQNETLKPGSAQVVTVLGDFRLNTESPNTDSRILDNNGDARIILDSSSPNVTFPNAVLVDGSADEAQLTVQGHSSQTGPILVVQNNSPTNKFEVDKDGHASFNGTLDSNAAVIVRDTHTQSSGTKYALHISPIITVSGLSNYNFMRVSGSININDGQRLATLHGLEFTPEIKPNTGASTSTLTRYRAINAKISITVASGRGITLTDLTAIRAENANVNNSGTISGTILSRGLHVEDQGDAEFDTTIGLDIEDQTGSTTLRSIRVLGGAVSIHQPDMAFGGTAAPTSTVDINGSFAVATVAKTGAYTAAIGDHVITCDASGGAFTVTLPAASGVAGRIYHIKKTDSSGNAVTVDGNSGETIDGALTQVINVQYDSMMIICDGSNWHII